VDRAFLEELSRSAERAFLEHLPGVGAPAHVPQAAVILPPFGHSVIASFRPKRHQRIGGCGLSRR